ncbi:MAG: ribosome recycling factor [Planctomycetota bacterium]|nr:ribosome recycling factor [Planctomycetota bacterium]
MPYDDIFLEADDKMNKSLTALADELKGIRTGRASPGLVDSIRVDYYGAPTPLKQLASVSVPDPRLIVVKPFDAGALPEIQKAIQKSELGINPTTDGKLVRLVVPPLSEERRRQLVKLVKDMAERARVSIRNVRRDALKQGDDEEDKGDLTEDEKFKLKEEIQKMTAEIEKKLGELLEKKQKEIMEV